ncbi:MAG TPA: two-component regulator propeller domain-containing protein [Mucilaginibacter sp.]|jgi:ligand-binding sensor domain-containing protein/DNA-binding response OmpR family regulator/anti-sigma regulatory factor (Ser/Thr protein kinase)
MKRYLAVLLLFIISGIHYTAGSQPVSYLGIEQGLSNNTVTTIYKDRFGFMWFGTLDGLNRFDSYNFKQFRSKFNNPSSLPNNRITALAEDNTGSLWVGTEKGIGILNNKTMLFSGIDYVPYGDGSGKTKFYDKGVNDIKMDKKGNVFICSEDVGLLLYEKNAKKAVQIPLLHNNTRITRYSAVTINIDSENNVWLMVDSWSLCFYNSKTRSIIPMSGNIPHANCIQRDIHGNLWIGTRVGLYFYDTRLHKMDKFKLKDKTLNKSKIFDIFFDKKQQLWLATDGEGIGVIDVFGTGDFRLMKQGNSGTLTSNAINKIYEDEQSRKWIGTLRGGIDVIDYKKSQFKTIVHNRNNNSLVSNFTFSFCEDGDKNVWIGTDGGGISVWNRKKNSFKNYVHADENVNSISNDHITGIVKDDQRNIWVSTFGGGVSKFNTATGNFENIPFFKENKNTPIWRLYIDGLKTIWASCLTGNTGNEWYRLFKYDKSSNHFIPAPFPINADIISMIDDNNENLWLGSFTGLLQVNKKSGITRSFDLKTAVRALHQSKTGKLWIGTYERGLMCYDKATGKFKNYTEDNGLSNNTVLNIEEDKKGYIWVSTYNGLSKLNPSTGKFENFFVADGLQSNQFYYNASAVLSSGEMLFGGIKGFNIFNPDSIRQFHDFPPIVLTGLSVFNIPVNAESEFVENGSSIYNADHISLPYDKAILSVDYIALEYSLPEKIQYAYFLKGRDKSWNYVNSQRTINYSQLNEGEYVLKIKSTNASGIWNPKEKLIYITVHPPWYRTGFAYLMYLTLIGSSAYGYLFYRQKQTRLQYEVKFTKELNEKKISFFTNISHELRTPLTLIVNPIKELLHNNGKNADLIDISSVYRNTRRLLSLVDQLLLFKTAENEISDLKPEWLNLTDVCQEVFLCFNNQAKAKSLQYHFEYSNEYIYIHADREKIEIILFNLLSNAIKFTPDHGYISLLLSEQNENVEILVKDTGRGIPEGTKDRLFEKFYRLTDANDATSPSGFGIGLFLTKKYVDIHHGNLTYTSILNEGTVFRISLPKGNAGLATAPVKNYEKEYVNSNLLKELVTEPVAPLSGDFNPESDNQLLDSVTTEKATILLIDDNLELRGYIKQLLKSTFNIYEANNAERGFEIITKTEPDIIVCDVVMQGMSGVEFCSKIKESPSLSHIPVILLTSSSSPEIKLKGIECGADDYITKPFENELLIARIKGILKGRSTLKQYFFNEITLKNNSSKIPAEYSEFLSKCIAVIEENLENEDFSLKTFTEEMGMSRSKLFRKIKSISGLSSTEFIRYIRLRKAAELMIQTDIQIKEVAFRVGIPDVKYFRQYFSKLFEMNPSDFIHKYRKTYIRNHNLNSEFAQQKNKH